MGYDVKTRIEACILDSKYPDEFVEMAIKQFEEVYAKAKTLDKVKNFITERLKEQKLTDEYDFGERFMCEEIEEIIGGQINEED